MGEADKHYNQRIERIFSGLLEVYSSTPDTDLEFGERVDLDGIGGYGNSCTIVLPEDVDDAFDTNLSRTEQFRILGDKLNYLSTCRDHDSWERTRSFVDSTDHPDRIAGFVHRMVEDAYINATRMQQFRGLSDAYLTRMEATYGSQETFPAVDELRHDAALLEGLRQLVYLGQVHGLADAEENLRGTLVWTQTKVDEARETSDPEQRDAIATELLERVLHRMYHPPLAADYLDNEFEAPLLDLQTVLPDVDWRQESDETDDDTVENDESTVDALAPVLFTFPMEILAWLFAKIGLKSSVQAFYDRLPDGPHKVFWIGYVLLVPVFLVWATVRKSTRRLGVWDSLVARWNRTGAAFRNGCVIVARRIKQSGRRLLHPMKRLWESDTGKRVRGGATTAAMGIKFGSLLPLIVTLYIAEFFRRDDEFGAYFRRLPNGPYDSYLPLYSFLLPVFGYWWFRQSLYERRVGDRLPFVSQSYRDSSPPSPEVYRERTEWFFGRIRDEIVALPRRIVRGILWVAIVLLIFVPTMFALFLSWLWSELLVRLQRGIYQTKKGIRTARGDNWRDDLGLGEKSANEPSRSEPQQDGQQTADMDSPNADSESDRGTDSDPQRRPTAQDDKSTGQTSDQNNEQTSDSRTDHGEEKNISRQPAITGEIHESSVDIESDESVFEAASELSTADEPILARGDDDVTGESALDSALEGLQTDERVTDAELQSRKRRREERVDGAGDVSELFAEMRRRGLHEEIQRLLETLPSEEKRDVRARSGYRLDMTAVAQTGGGQHGTSDRLFYQRRNTNLGERTVGVAIDLSGSMAEKEARLTLAGLAEATHLLDDTFLALGFRGSYRTYLPLVTAPKEQFQRRHLSGIDTEGGTPVADGVRELRRLAKRTNDETKILFVITDGKPNTRLQERRTESGSAVEDARKQVERTRRDDMLVVGIGVGSVRHGDMESVFGQDGYVMGDKETLAEDLLEVYRDQLQRR